MKTHELAAALEILAKILRQGSNDDLEVLSHDRLRRPKPDIANVPVALSTLVALSRVDKQQWQAVIQEYGFPVEIRPRDASRDILGKLLNHLEQNPEARKRLGATKQPTRSDVSPELMAALQHLLK